MASLGAGSFARIHGMLRECYTGRTKGPDRAIWHGYHGPMTHPAADHPRATPGPRILGIAIDWLLCMLISSAFFTSAGYAQAQGFERVLLAGAPLATLLIWAAQHLILVATLGTTIGHRVAGLRVVRPDGGVVGISKAAIRTGLLALIIPAVVVDDEGQGLHDRVAGTRLISTRGPR